MTKPAINMAVERSRVEVENRHRHLAKISKRYLTDAEQQELRDCVAWLKKNARAWEKLK